MTILDKRKNEAKEVDVDELLIQEEGSKRNLGGLEKKIFAVWAFLGMLIQLYSIFIGYFTTQVHVAIHLMFCLSIAFLMLKPKKERKSHVTEKIPWYDWTLSILSLLPTLHLIINWESIMSRGARPTSIDVIFAFLFVILLLEGTRRAMGMALPIIAVIFISYAFLGQYLPDFLGHRGTSIARFTSIQYMTTEGILSSPAQVSSKMILMFILFGSFLFGSGAGDKLMNIALSIAGKQVGGPGKVAVISSSLMGMVSGSASANVATTGQFTIPMMKKMGFTSTMAGAIEAVASTGGTLAPPIMGAGAFIMAETLGVSYLTVVKAGIIPAIIYYLCCFIIVHFEAKKLGLTGLPKEELPSKFKSLKEGYMVIIPLMVLIYLVFTYYPIMKAALAAIITLIIISLFKKETRIGIRTILDSLINAMKDVTSLALCCATAGIVIGCISVTGLGPKFAFGLSYLTGNNTILALLIAMVVTIILGMGLPATAAYVVGASIVAPALLEFGFKPIGTQMFVFYFSCLAQVTPPVALAAYVGAAIAGSNPLKTAITASRLVLVSIIVPFIFIYHTTLLLDGPVGAILWDSTIAMLGCTFAAIGLSGYFKTNMLIPERTILVVGGLLLVLPGLTTDIVGAMIVAFGIFYNIKASKKNTSAA
ncbi:MAG: C4-dicarboxylate ABC transporter permease [Firmicutes bacterium HGW-Firmicutes-12]|jgi:TRAP transporter 4TM/12TM fusion protein|nr:MAG: C4-dicarboxylate ABC transporter permease [Firmicutes bacterium HGW-Firmicutes-12]